MVEENAKQKPFFVSFVEERMGKPETQQTAVIREYLSVIHGGSSGYICVSKNAKDLLPSDKIRHAWRQRHYKLDELQSIVTALQNENDVYISMNRFRSPKKYQDNVSELNACFVDIDYYNSNLTLNEVMETICADIAGGKIPRPTLIVNSGRGLQMIWKIAPIWCGGEKAASIIALYRRVQEYLCYIYRNIGADSGAKDVSRVFRLPGTINSKNGAMCEMLDKSGVTYELRTLLSFIPKDWVSEGEGKPKSKVSPRKSGSASSVKLKHHPKYAKSLENGYELKIYSPRGHRHIYLNRINDLIRLCQLRGWKMEPRRELTLFLFRQWVCAVKGPEAALEETLRLNNCFVDPLDEDEVRQATTNRYQLSDKCKVYRYRNSSIIEMLCITEKEQAFLHSIISEKERARRRYLKKRWDNKKRDGVDETGLTRKRRQMVECAHKAFMLRNMGLSYAQIAARLGISKATAIRMVDRFKNDVRGIRGDYPVLAAARSKAILHVVDAPSRTYSSSSSRPEGGKLAASQLLSYIGPLEIPYGIRGEKKHLPVYWRFILRNGQFSIARCSYSGGYMNIGKEAGWGEATG